MKKYILTLLLFFPYILMAQSTDGSENMKNKLFGELFGNGYLYSLNYERALLKNVKVEFSGRIGLSYYYQLHEATYLPISVQAYYGHKTKLEIGIGYLPIFRWSKIKEEGTVFNYDKSKYTMTSKDYIQGHDEPYASAAFINIGLHQGLKQNFFFKAAFSPWIAETNNGYALVPWGRLAFGKNF